MSMPTKKIVLKSSDGKIFEVEEAVILQSKTIAHMVEDNCVENGIPLPNITGNILAKVIEYCNEHVNDDHSSQEELKYWDADFMKIDLSMILDIIMAANFLNIKNLLDLSCQRVADMIKDKTPEEIRTIFNIENDFTPEEEAAIRKENQWAFE